MAAPPPPTILELKAAFIQQQVRTLSTPLRLPTGAAAAADDDAGSALLAPKATQAALHKANQLLRRHVRLACGPRAQRHVAEQIDRLHADAATATPAEGPSWADRRSDFATAACIAQLPATWEGPVRGPDAPRRCARYDDLRARLVQLSARRSRALARVARRQALSGLMHLVAGREELQRNLVTRDGELEVELERMRRLMVRVERGIEGLPQKSQDPEEPVDPSLDMDESKDTMILGLFT